MTSLPDRVLRRLRRFCRALLLLSFLALPLPHAAPSAAQQEPPSQTQAAAATTDPERVKFTVTVLGERGGFIAGLTRDSFVVSEGKSEREINYFNGDALPASVGILFDTSASVRTDKLKAAKAAALGFVERSHPENEYFVNEFASSTRELTDWTHDREKIAEAVNGVARADDGAGKKTKLRGLTALYDTGLAALEKVSRGRNPKRVLLIIGDAGADNASKHKFNELKNKIRESDVLIYSIGISERTDDFLNVVGQTILDELSALSGGRAYFPHLGKELEEVVERLAIELQHQYVIGFKPANAAPGGKWNKVKVKMSPANEQFKKFTVRAREGYFSPPVSP